MSKEKLEDIKATYHIKKYGYNIRNKWNDSDIADLMQLVYNQALEDVKEKAKRPDTDMYDSFIDEDLIDNLKIK